MYLLLSTSSITIYDSEKKNVLEIDEHQSDTESNYILQNRNDGRIDLLQVEDDHKSVRVRGQRSPRGVSNVTLLG